MVRKALGWLMLAAGAVLNLTAVAIAAPGVVLAFVVMAAGVALIVKGSRLALDTPTPISLGRRGG